MLNIKSHDNVKKEVEAQVIAAMQKQGYTLNAVNNYGENLLHISAANDCFRIVKEILGQKKNCRVIDRKNKFGWSPLMQAIRNGNIDTVKMLLEKNANIDDATYLGMSVLGLAAAISKEMFETVYNVYPDALANAANDDITPLCVAAMKNDKELFFRLLELGMPLSTANNYTRIMMRRSTVPEIIILAEEYLATDDYWNDTSDNIQVISEQSKDDMTGESSKSILKNDKKRKHKSMLSLLSIPPKSDMQDLLSPNLTYDTFALSPNLYFTNMNFAKRSNILFPEKDANNKAKKSNLEKYPVTSEYQLKSPLAVSQKSQSLKPLDLGLQKFSNNSDTTVEFTPEFSPLKSPHVPPEVNEENVFGENTPTPPRCTTPPKGMLLNWQQTKMIMILRRFGFSQYISVFLEQEVDIDLFLTLTDKDLIEIGIENERDRRTLLERIEEYKNRLAY